MTVEEQAEQIVNTFLHKRWASALHNKVDPMLNELRRDITAALTRAVAQALNTYGKHLVDCDIDYDEVGTEIRACTCGLSTLRARSGQEGR